MGREYTIVAASGPCVCKGCTQVTPTGVFMLHSAQGPGKPGMCTVCVGAIVHLLVQALCVYIYDMNMHDALLMGSGLAHGHWSESVHMHAPSGKWTGL